MTSVAPIVSDTLAYLDIYLGPLAEALHRPEVTDLYVNQPGEIWIETLGGQIERISAPVVTDALLWRLARQVASITHQAISREHPLLAATLGDGSRIQVIAPPATRGPIAIAIRKHIAAELSLDDYETSGMFATAEPSGARTSDTELHALYVERAWSAFLRAAVKARKTVIVSGGTSTGKTTFLGALLREIDPDERLILIEDTPELRLTHDNAIALVAARGQQSEANVTSVDLLIASLRMRPDRIILGELRGTEAFTFLRAINSGHPGSLTTVHADTPALAVQQLALMVLQAGLALNRSDIVSYVETTVDIIVQLGRHAGTRRVSEVWWRDAACSDY